MNDFKIAGIIDAPGLYTLVEEKVFDSAVTSFDFVANLDGDNDGGYMIETIIHNPTGSNASYFFRYNDNTGRLRFDNRQYFFMNGSSGTALRTTTDGDIGVSVSANQSSHSTLSIPVSKTGNARGASLLDVRNFATTGATMTVIEIDVSLSAPNSSTNITGFGIESTVASSIGIGSILRLYKVR